MTVTQTTSRNANTKSAPTRIPKDIQDPKGHQDINDTKDHNHSALPKDPQDCKSNQFSSIQPGNRDPSVS